MGKICLPEISCAHAVEAELRVPPTRGEVLPWLPRPSDMRCSRIGSLGLHDIPDVLTERCEVRDASYPLPP